jgi:hypothetical protein
MKLDVNVLRYLGRDEFRTLTAVEMGQKNVSARPPARLPAAQPPSLPAGRWPAGAGELPRILRQCSMTTCALHAASGPPLAACVPAPPPPTHPPPPRAPPPPQHEIVPAQLVDSIAGLKHGGAFKCLKTLLRHKLVHHDSQK